MSKDNAHHLGMHVVAPFSPFCSFQSSMQAARCGERNERVESVAFRWCSLSFRSDVELEEQKEKQLTLIPICEYCWLCLLHIRWIRNEARNFTARKRYFTIDTESKGGRRLPYTETSRACMPPNASYRMIFDGSLFFFPLNPYAILIVQPGAMCRRLLSQQSFYCRGYHDETTFVLNSWGETLHNDFCPTIFFSSMVW